jgi:hypothetical protein
MVRIFVGYVLQPYLFRSGAFEPPPFIVILSALAAKRWPVSRVLCCRLLLVRRFLFSIEVCIATKLQRDVADPAELHLREDWWIETDFPM